MVVGTPVLLLYPDFYEGRLHDLEDAPQLWDEPDEGQPPLKCAFMEGCFWLYQAETGAISFGDRPSLVACYPADYGQPEVFLALVKHSWLPLVYVHWGWQVLHAAAAYQLETRRLIAFTGDSQAGKSTLAYALGQRVGWQQFADDTLRFSQENGRITLSPSFNTIRLRPASARYFGQPSGQQPIVWPDDTPVLSAIYALAEPETGSLEARISPLSAGESYPLLLHQAYCLTKDVPVRNRRLALDYLTLLGQVPVYRLAYPRHFDRLDATLDLVEQHAQTQLPPTKARL